MNPLPLHKFVQDTADIYGRNWFAFRADAEEARAWDSLPAFFRWDLWAKGEGFEARLELPLRRDLEAWHEDPSHGNFAMGPSELDINVPYRAWGRMDTKLGSVKIGRYDLSFSPSPHGVILAGAPWHDAFWWHWPILSVEVDYIVSSLNPALLGTPATAGAEAPEGSEAWRQSHLSISNQRKRIYDEPSKTLFFHRIAWKPGRWELAIVEQALIGGKSPTLRDGLPFLAWHNNFGDGYTKSSTGFETRVHLGRIGRVHAQYVLEDLASPVGETEGEINGSVMAANVGWQGAWATGSGHQFSARFDATYTDPTYGNHRLPLLRMTSRHMYRSNDRAQDDPAFADTWVVDYPLGYHRGPDAADLWFQLAWTDRSGRFGSALDLAWLTQGEATVYDDVDSLPSRHGHTGIVETEVRASASGWWQGSEGFRLSASGGFSALDNANHIQDRTSLRPTWALASIFTIP